MGKRETEVGRGQLLSLSVVTDSYHLSMDSSPPGSLSVYEIFQASNTGWLAVSSSGESSYPGIEPVPPALAGRFFFFFLPLSHQGDNRRGKGREEKRETEAVEEERSP